MFKTLHKVNWYADVVLGNDEPSKGDKIRFFFGAIKTNKINIIFFK